MPTRKRICSYPGCGKLIPIKETYCQEHYKQMNQEYERTGRDPATKHRYKSREYRKARAIKVRTVPYCEECYKRKLVIPVEEVHHIIPLSEGGTNDQSNLMSLCKSCHARIHAERGDRWGRKKE